MIIIYSVLLTLFIILTGLQYFLFDGFNNVFLASLIPNMLVTIIGLYLTVFVIGKLLERDSYKKSVKFLKDTLEHQSETFISGISTEFLIYVNKKSPSYRGGISLAESNRLINEVIHNIDKNVNSNFINDSVKVLLVDPNSFQSNELTVSYQDYSEYFKRSTTNSINQSWEIYFCFA